MAIIEAMETSDAREEGGSANDDDDDADDEDDTRIRFAGWSSISLLSSGAKWINKIFDITINN
jgi:hypothetical protein